MSLTLIKSALSTNTMLASQMSFDAWVADQQMRGEKVKLFRDYADGNHRANLTPEMRRLLRISNAGTLNEFNDNYCDIIVQTVVDRLELTAVEGDDDKEGKPDAVTLPADQSKLLRSTSVGTTENTPPQQIPLPIPEKKQDSPATVWAADLLKRNRFDAMQSDIWEAAIRDGDTYLLVYWDNEQKRVRFSHEPAFDGVSGMLVLYETMASEKPLLAIKIWHITTETTGKTPASIANTMRVNVYYEDRIERYIAPNGQQLMPYSTVGAPSREAWVDSAGMPIGVPVVHFRNRKAKHDNYGMSEIENAIPLQDALNRVLYSSVMVSELTAFRILVARGFDPPTGITPGAIVKISPNVVMSKDETADLTALEGGSTADHLAFMKHLVGEMGNITNTPRLTPMGQGSDVSSGEALKQREIGLIGKIKRFQVKAGNAVEDTVTLAARIQSVYGDAPPESEFYYARWKDPEIRNEGTIIDNALKVVDYVDERTFLEMVAPVYGWDAKKIDIIQEKNAVERNAKMAPMPVIQPFETDMAQSKANEMMGRLNGTAIPVPA